MDFEDNYDNGGDSKYSPQSSAKRFKEVLNIVHKLGFYAVNEGIVDVGCGPGNFVSYFEDKGIKVRDYLGIDVREDALKVAKDRHPHRRFSLSWHDEDPVWDIACGIGLCGHVTDKSIDKCVDNDIDLLMRMYENCRKCIVFTLPRAGWSKPCTMPLVRYFAQDAVDIIDGLLKKKNRPFILDGATFPHEYLIGVSKVDNP